MSNSDDRYTSNGSSGKPAEGPFAEDRLPPVEAPSASFLLQLFVIPMVIVMIIVMVWMMFSWLAHMGSDPKDLVRDLKTLNDASWQKAYTLSNLLRSPEYDHLKDDVQLARELAVLLESQIEAGSMSEDRIKLRMFLCRALGEFRVAEGLPALLQAATVERDVAEFDVRRTALEAIAVLATNVGPELLRSDADLLEVLQAASRERGNSQEDRARRAELRTAAAFTLGVIGGQESRDRLARMLGDTHTNTRYNAATGLARHGDTRAMAVLIEMLDPDNERAVSGEGHESGREWKQTLVIVNGVRATRQLGESNETADLQPLQTALERLVNSDLQRSARLEAQEALHVLQARRPALEAAEK